MCWWRRWARRDAGIEKEKERERNRWMMVGYSGHWLHASAVGLRYNVGEYPVDGCDGTATSVETVRLSERRQPVHCEVLGSSRHDLE